MLHSYILLLPCLFKFDSRKASFWLKRAVSGIKFRMCYIHTFSFYHASLNLIPGKLLSGSKEPFWKSNFLCVYILLLPYLLKFDSRKAAFWLKRAVSGIKFRMCYIHTFSFYHASLNLIPGKLLSGSKEPFWKSNFLCVYILLLPYLWKFDSRVYILPLSYLLKFDSRKAACWLKRAVLGIKFPMCIHFPSTMPLEI